MWSSKSRRVIPGLSRLLDWSRCRFESAYGSHRRQMGCGPIPGSRNRDCRRTRRGAGLEACTRTAGSRYERIDLAFDKPPSAEEFTATAMKPDAAGYHARVQLARLDKGEALRTKISYPIQSWSFGDSLAMVFLPGEVVVDYSRRLKSRRSPVTMSGYGSTPMPTTIPVTSRRA